MKRWMTAVLCSEQGAKAVARFVAYRMIAVSMPCVYAVRAAMPAAVVCLTIADCRAYFVDLVKAAKDWLIDWQTLPLDPACIPK